MNRCALWGIGFLMMATSVFGNRHPEEELILIPEFVSPETARSLINCYNKAHKTLNNHTDNQLALHEIQSPEIRSLVLKISDEIIGFLKEKNGKTYLLDHAGLYCRIKDNYCGYHADNVYFYCPIHGRDQQVLRKICDGTCPGSKYVPNHTARRVMTALIYLNDDFEGGEILFEDGPANKIYRKVFSIKERMLLLAPNGPHFYHEVFPIRSGKRYSLHLWFMDG